jgi:phosphocarrier protein
MTSCAVVVTNALGLHARAAARFVHTASAFSSNIRVGRGGREMDGKSIMGILLLSAARGSRITIRAEGTDEVEAVEALRALVERGFDEAPFDPAPGGSFGGAQGQP